MTASYEEFADLFSDDSSFNGDDKMKQEYEDRAAAFDTEAIENWWRNEHPDLPSVIANRNIIAERLAAEKVAAKAAAKAKAENSSEEHASGSRRHRHDGKEERWQVGELISDFTARLPPSSTPEADLGPWIYVRNPFDKSIRVAADIAGLVSEGQLLLEQFENDKTEAEHKLKKTPSRRAGTIYSLRRKLEKELFAIARQKQVITGKWMLFVDPEGVDKAWVTVAEATSKGELGLGAKVATDSGTGGSRLIAIYTPDYKDMEDVRRVLHKIVELELVNPEKNAIYYKCDAYTHLGIMSKNQWGLKPSIYSSKDVLRN